MTAEAFLRWGGVLIWGGLAFALLLLGLAAWQAQELVAYVPVVLIAAGLVFILLGHPVLNLAVLLGAFVLIADYEEGIQLTEVLYGLYYLGFLGYFLFSRIFLRDERVAERVEEKALLLFLVAITLSIGTTILLKGSLQEVLSQWTALVLLMLYFPIKEVFLKDERAPVLLFTVVAWVGLFAALRNYYVYYTMLSSAEHLWQIARGRVYTNDNLFMVSSLCMLVLLIFADRWKQRLLLLPLFLAPLGGLVLTQSRGFWVAFVFGAFLLLLLVKRRERIRLALLGSGGLIGVGVLGFLFFGDSLGLILSGLIERAGSLGSATTRDVSLYNRFMESEAVWAEIRRNPIIGYGIGVPYRFLDLTFMATRVDTFIHNGFLSVWYRFGIFGLLFLLVAWGGAIRRGYQAFRTTSANRYVRLAGLASVISLGAYVLPANTSNPFHLNDSIFIFAVLFGMAGGAAACARRSMDEHEVPLLS